MPLLYLSVSMKAVVYRKFGAPEVLHIEDVAEPVVRPNDLLVFVHATAVTAGDIRIRAARFPKGFGPLARLFVFGVFAPRRKVLGICFSGEVVGLGDAVSNFKFGDRVCGMSGLKMGAYAEKITIDSRKSVASIPKNVSYKEAAGVLFGGTAALYFLKKLGVKKGESILVNGSTGAVGTNAVQIAKLMGAQVTGVGNGKYSRLLTSIGVDTVIDYRKQQLPEGSKNFDVVLDCVGNITPNMGRSIVNSRGRVGLMVADVWQIMRHGKQVFVGTASETAEDISYILSLVEKKKLRVVIDKVFTPANMVKAHTHAESGAKVGNVVVAVK